MNEVQFKAGMNRLFALRVESRLSTKELQECYCSELSRLVSSEAWTHCVDEAMSTQTILPAPAWFLQCAKKFEEAEAQRVMNDRFKDEQSKLKDDFPPELTKQNISRLQDLMKNIKSV